MIFVDTSAFLAIENRRDTYHGEAIRFRDSCLKTGEALITSDYVLDETYTIIRLRAGHNIAVQFGEDIRASKLLRIEYVTPEIIELAWRVFKTFADHDFSFTDCTSFMLMDRLGINTVFTFDTHFREYGQFIVRP
jgi:Predicted nucleic acid-binding protein, contains PIN domain